MLNGILTLDQLQLHPHQSNYEWFPWSVCNRCGMPEGNAYPSGLLLQSCFLRLVYAPIVETIFQNLPCLFFDFSPWIPLNTVSILPLNPDQLSCWHYGTFEMEVGTRHIKDNLTTNEGEVFQDFKALSAWLIFSRQKCCCVVIIFILL